MGRLASWCWGCLRRWRSRRRPSPRLTAAPASRGGILVARAHLADPAQGRHAGRLRHGRRWSDRPLPRRLRRAGSDQAAQQGHREALVRAGLLHQAAAELPRGSDAPARCLQAWRQRPPWRVRWTTLQYSSRSSRSSRTSQRLHRPRQNRVEQGWAVRLGRLRWDSFITGWQLELGGKEWSWCLCAEASENVMRERRGRNTGCWCWLLVL